MTSLSRRAFLKTGAMCGLATNAGAGGVAAAAGRARAAGDPAAETVFFFFDGIDTNPAEYARQLGEVHGQPMTHDVYMSGGPVEELEKAFAAELGKEAAVFVATGTLANHLAIRRLAGDKTKVLVQAESHIYADSFDTVQTLSHLNLVPLARGRATFTRDEVEETCRWAVDGPYPAPVGAISIECPVRRQHGEVFDFEELRKISEYARKERIGLHLDGARLYLASAYTGISPKQYAALADTVYISLYKYLGAASGAILTGPKQVIDQVAHDRKVFGGTLYQAWPFAAVALRSLGDFSERFGRAVACSRELAALLDAHPRFEVESFKAGTNIFRLRVQGVDGETYRGQLEKRGVILRKPEKAGDPASFLLSVNESINRRSARELSKTFVESLG